MRTLLPDIPGNGMQTEQVIFNGTFSGTLIEAEDSADAYDPEPDSEHTLSLFYKYNTDCGIFNCFSHEP